MLPLRFHCRALCLQLGQLTFECHQPLARGRISLLLHRLTLNFELHHAALHFVDRLGQRVDLDAKTAGRFIEQVDCLVGKKAVTDIAIGQRCRCHDCAVGDADSVVRLVARLEAAQNCDRIVQRRFADKHRLKPTLQRCILFEMLTIFVQRGCADHVQLAARQHRLQHIAGIHRAFSPARPDQRMQFVDEYHDFTFTVDDLLQNCLQALFELTTEFRAGDQCPEIERQQALAAQAFRYIAVHDALRQTFNDRRLANAGLSDQHRIVLGATREYLDHAPDFVIATDNRIELSVPRAFREIARVALQCLIAILRCLVRHLVRPAHRLQRACERVARCTHRRQQRLAVGAFDRRQRKQEMLGADIVVAERLGIGVGTIEYLIQLARDLRLCIALFRISRGVGFRPLAQLGRLHARLLQQRHHDAVLLCDEREQQMHVIHQRIAGATRRCDGFIDCFAGLDRKAVGIQHQANRG